MVLPALVSHQLKIPLIHLGGGEITKNSPDNNYRKIISKLSTYHFCSSLYAKKRLNKLGVKKNIKIVGVTSFEELSKFDFSENKKILKKYNLNKNEFVLFSYHSETIDLQKEKKLIDFTLKRLLKLNYKIIITSSNNDFNGRELNDYLKKITNHHIIFINSIGSEFYKYFLYNCKFMIGNSSSGIIESVFFKKLNISIGDRQIGRDHDKNTFFLRYNFKKIQLFLSKIENKIMHILKIKYIYKKYKSSNVVARALVDFE